MKMKYPCRKCGQYGHCAKVHNIDRFLPSNVKSVSNYSAINMSNNKAHVDGAGGKKKSCSFTIRSLVKNVIARNAKTLGANRHKAE